LSPEREATDKIDVEHLHAIARGDEKAFASLYDTYNSILLGLLLRILNSRVEAEDVLQEVFLQVWQRASTFDEARGRPFTWLVTLTRSRAIDRLRSSNARERTALAAALDAPESTSDDDASDEVVRSEQSELVHRALDAIPEEQRRTLLLAYFEGLTQTEIAERLKQPLGTVKTRMRAGMIKLRELLGKRRGGSARMNL
jgi:RNA polymerase sigma-70 factor (ECF subfamily)